jgi:hypothetical protein
MYINVKSKAYSRCFYSKAFVSLLFVAVLASSCFISMFSNGVSLFVLGASDRIVSNEVELRTAINNAVGSTVIALDNDITLTEQLVIPANKDITLTSTSTSKFFKLVGGGSRTTLGPGEYSDAVINVKGDGVLKLEGIIVPCPNNILAWNNLVRVEVRGVLILYSGELSDNSLAGAVGNGGTFEMYGGKIANNNGAGVGNGGSGTFSMFGGEISNNKGFGVSNGGMFSMFGGVISNNDGGGVQNSGTFSMFGGEISNNMGRNIMQSGGGVSNSGIFGMSGGVISNNQATYGGGVYNWPNGNFSLFESGVISNNKAEGGGGVYNAGTFNRNGGVISGNTATQYGNIYSDGDGSTTDGDGSTTNVDSTDNTMCYVVLVVSIVVLVSIVVGLFSYKKNNKK